MRTVAISDVIRLRDDAEFYDSSEPATRRFPVVIASEVIEHFLEPREDFERLFGFVEPDGLLVCSTNVYDGGNLAASRTSSRPVTPRTTPRPRSRCWPRRTAGSWTCATPLVATGYGGPRKRYVLFTASPSVLESIQAYFVGREYAPSDPPWEDPVTAAH